MRILQHTSRCLLPVLGFLSLASALFSQTRREQTGVLVIGGGTGGVAAGLQASRLGVKTTIVEQTSWLGGMLTAAGVSCTDGNDKLNSGIWQEFREELYKHYGKRNLATGWVSATCFEPRVGDSIFKALASRERNLEVLYQWYFETVTEKTGTVKGAIFKNAKGDSLIIEARMVIDATDLGDAFASADADFDVGMEDKSYSHESMAPGKNEIIQDLTWVAILKDIGKPSTELLRPRQYDSTLYFCSCTDAPCPEGKPYKVNATTMLDYAKLPNGYYMINWPAHGNDYYLNVIDLKPRERDRVFETARQQTLGFVYFIQTSLGKSNLVLPKAYFPGMDGLALIPYHREGRRVKGIVRLNVNQLIDPYAGDEKLYRTGIAVGDYPVDHHHGKMKDAPAIKFPKVNSFNIPLGALVPEKVNNLIVADKGISVSNMANGATRLQPCVLLTGQAAGTLAAWCLKNDKQPREANIREIQLALLAAKAWLMPYFDIDTTHPAWMAAQVTGIAGTIRGFGKSEGWENKTYFYPDSLMRFSEWQQAMKAYDASFIISYSKPAKYLPISVALKAVYNYCAKSSDPTLKSNAQKLGADSAAWSSSWVHLLGLESFEANRNIKRAELAILLYQMMLKNGGRAVGWKGNWLK